MSAFATVILYVAPLRTLPGEVEALRHEMTNFAQVQAVQAESLKMLADVVSDTKVIRRDVDSNTVRVQGLEVRVDKLENKHPH